MSNPESINISSSTVTGKCDLKCAYNFNYSDSAIAATNTGISISFPYDTSNSSPVIYNQQPYNVQNVQIYCPSINIYNGSQAAGEIIITHTPVQGGDNLFVCVPFINSTSATTASNLLTQLITDMATSAPTEGETANININGFTLQSIVPTTPYYSFISTSSQFSGDFIVFDINNAIPIGQNTLTTLGNIIDPFNIIISGNNLFYNSNGPTTSSSGADNDGIYISCQPTGASEEEVNVITTNPITNDLMKNIFNNPTALLVFQVIIGCILFIIIFFILNFLMNIITGDGIKIPGFLKQKTNGHTE